MTTAELALPVGDAALAERLRQRMAVVEAALFEHASSRAPFVSEAARHLLAAGGKRFRPLLVLLAAEAGTHPDAEDVLTAACVVEITHLGSLYHDDVMDEASLRRGADSANSRWDNHVAILTGDFLFAKSSELTATLGAEAVRIQAETFTRLVEGQILETVAPGPADDPLQHYLDVVAGKTGSLIATSARYGARFGGATVEVEQALTAYGEIVGAAFQLSDDILDVASESDESGKTPGTDLREGVPTLPVLMALASKRPGRRSAPRAAARRPHRRRPARRGPRPAPPPPGHGAGPCLRRRARRGGEVPPRRPPRRTGALRPRGLRRRGRRPLHLTRSRTASRRWSSGERRSGSYRWSSSERRSGPYRWSSSESTANRCQTHCSYRMTPPLQTVGKRTDGQLQPSPLAIGRPLVPAAPPAPPVRPTELYTWSDTLSAALHRYSGQDCVFRRGAGRTGEPGAVTRHAADVAATVSAS